MSDFVLDSDPLIPTGVPADPVQVGALILGDVLPADAITELVADQQPTPEDLGAACVASGLPTEDAVAKLIDAGLYVVLPEAPPVEAD